jgi:hypothetical protein
MCIPYFHIRGHGHLLVQVAGSLPLKNDLTGAQGESPGHSAVLRHSNPTEPSPPFGPWWEWSPVDREG